MTEGQEGGRIVARLKRIEGQVSGIGSVEEDDKPWVDTLLEASAVHSELSKVGQLMLARHMETGVTAALASGDESKRQEPLEEPLDVFARCGGA